MTGKLRVTRLAERDNAALAKSLRQRAEEIEACESPVSGWAVAVVFGNGDQQVAYDAVNDFVMVGAVEGIKKLIMEDW